MSIEAMQDYTYVSKYARYNKYFKRRETWSESVTRVKEMHLRKYPKAKADIEWAFDRVLEQRALGSQRALQFGGEPIEKINERIFNCTASYCDRPRFFQESLFLLLCGCGVGFSVQQHHINKLPNIEKPKDKTKLFIIDDSIQGWSDALGVLLSNYFIESPFPEWHGLRVEFDYSRIRKKGRAISSGTGKAPGPEPLRKSLENIRKILDECVKYSNKLKPINAYDIVMHSSDAVLSGGIRRSATICLFSPEDKEMACAKTGDWFYENPQRARSNNSVLLVRNKTSKEQYKEVMKGVKEFGEPGVVWADSTECIVNPCVEVNFYTYDIYGNTGWQACNLSEINGKKIKSRKDFEIAARAASIIGTLQAGYTSFPYLGKPSERITEREALIGVSITGMMEQPDIIFDPEIQRQMAELVKNVNEEIAFKIGINPSARCTVVKPSGTASCLLGTSSGIHPHHSKRYFRRMQGNNMEAPLIHFSKSNPMAVENSVWSANKEDSVITFCVEIQDEAKTKKEIQAIKLLEYVKLTQQNWIEYGTRKERLSQPWIRNSVSNTISVKSDEWDDVIDYIYNERNYLAGISLIPSTGDLDYPQAPFCSVSTPKEIIEKYGDGSVFASGLIVDGLHAFDDLWKACDCVLGRIKADTDLQEDWVRRANQFSDRYFEGNINKMLYCLKEVNNWKLWCDLKRSWNEVDYETLIEETDETSLLKEGACQGGTCEI